MNTLPLLLPTLFTLSFAGMGCLCLAMPRYARQRSTKVGGAQWLHRKKPIRVGGWLLLGLAIMASVSARGWGIGLTLILGVLSACTLAIISLVTYQPRWLIYSTVFNSAAGLLLLGPVLLM